MGRARRENGIGNLDEKRLSKNTDDGMKTGNRKQRIGERAYGAFRRMGQPSRKNYFPTLAYTWYNKLFFSGSSYF